MDLERDKAIEKGRATLESLTSSELRPVGRPTLGLARLTIQHQEGWAWTRFGKTRPGEMRGNLGI